MPLAGYRPTSLETQEEPPIIPYAPDWATAPVQQTPVAQAYNYAGPSAGPSEEEEPTPQWSAQPPVQQQLTVDLSGVWQFITNALAQQGPVTQASQSFNADVLPALLEPLQRAAEGGPFQNILGRVSTERPYGPIAQAQIDWQGLPPILSTAPAAAEQLFGVG